MLADIRLDLALAALCRASAKIFSRFLYRLCNSLLASFPESPFPKLLGTPIFWFTVLKPKASRSAKLSISVSKVAKTDPQRASVIINKARPQISLIDLFIVLQHSIDTNSIDCNVYFLREILQHSIDESRGSRTVFTARQLPRQSAIWCHSLKRTGSSKNRLLLLQRVNLAKTSHQLATKSIVAF